MKPRPHVISFVPQLNSIYHLSRDCEEGKDNYPALLGTLPPDKRVGFRYVIYPERDENSENIITRPYVSFSSSSSSEEEEKPSQI